MVVASARSFSKSHQQRQDEEDLVASSPPPTSPQQFTSRGPIPAVLPESHDGRREPTASERAFGDVSDDAGKGDHDDTVAERVATAVVRGASPEAVLDRVAAEGAVALSHLADGDYDLSTYRSDEATRKQILLDYPEYKKVLTAVKARLRKEKSPLATIAIEDLMALRAYSERAYTAMNASLRGRAPEELPLETPTIKGAASALAQMPTFKGQLYRYAELRQESFATYHVGATVTEKAFTSTSAIELRAVAAAAKPPGREPRVKTLFVISSLGGGKDVSAIAKSAGEREVIFAPGTSFKVLSHDRDAEHDRVIVNLVEETGPQG